MVKPLAVFARPMPLDDGMQFLSSRDKFAAPVLRLEVGFPALILVFFLLCLLPGDGHGLFPGYLGFVLADIGRRLFAVAQQRGR